MLYCGSKKRQTRQRRAAASQPPGESKGGRGPLALRGILKGETVIPPLERVFCILFCTSRKVWGLPLKALRAFRGKRMRCIRAFCPQAAKTHSLRDEYFQSSKAALKMIKFYFAPAGAKLHSITVLRQQSCQEL